MFGFLKCKSHTKHENAILIHLFCLPWETSSYKVNQRKNSLHYLTSLTSKTCLAKHRDVLTKISYMHTRTQRRSLNLNPNWDTFFTFWHILEECMHWYIQNQGVFPRIQGNWHMGGQESIATGDAIPDPSKTNMQQDKRAARRAIWLPDASAEKTHSKAWQQFPASVKLTTCNAMDWHEESGWQKGQKKNISNVTIIEEEAVQSEGRQYIC